MVCDRTGATEDGSSTILQGTLQVKEQDEQAVMGSIFVMEHKSPRAPIAPMPRSRCSECSLGLRLICNLPPSILCRIS